jgi:hypothetical protein
MLPWRVQSHRLAEAFRTDPAFRNRMLAFVVAMVLLVGSFAKGVELTVKIGGDDTQALAAGVPGTVLADGSVVNDDGTITAPDGTTVTTTGDGTLPSPSLSGAGARSAAGGGASGGGATAAAGGGAAPAAAASAGDPTRDPKHFGTYPSNPACRGARLSDTDQGVTADTIKLGFLVANLNELNAAGFQVGIAGDSDKIINAWVNAINEAGGIACRKVEWVKETFDVLSVDDMIAKCKAMTEDHKVFAVMTTGGYDSVAQLCIAKDHQTPFINPEPEPEQWYRDAAPYLWNLLMSKDRMHRNHIRYLVQSGELVPGKTKVGVVYHGVPNVAPSVEGAMLPELDRLGIKPVKVVSLSSDSQQALAQINQTVLQFRQAGVEYVLFPMNLIFKTQFLTTAENQGWFPKYTDSDHYFGCFDFTTDTYPERAFEGTKCVSALEIAGMKPDDGRAFLASHPFAQYADAIYAKTNPEGYGEDQEAADGQRALHLSLGSIIMLFEQAAERVGPNITRPAWGESMGQTGEFRQVPSPTPLTFGPEKWDGPNRIAVVEWRGAAGDGWNERSFRRIRDPLDALA